MAFMYLGEREPKQDMASMLAQAGATGLGVFNQLQYQKDQPEYRLALERLKNMQLSQQAIAGLPTELQQEVYTGINAARMSPGRAATEGDLAWASKVGSPGSMPWQSAQNKLLMEGQGIAEGDQKLEAMRRENRVENVLEPSKIAVGQMAPEKERAGISSLQQLTKKALADTEQTLAVTKQMPEMFNLEKRKVAATESGVGAHWASVTVAGREADTHANEASNKEKQFDILLQKEKEGEMKAFRAANNAASLDTMKSQEYIRKTLADSTIPKAEKMTLINGARASIERNIDESLADIRRLPASEAAIKKGYTEGISKSIIDLAKGWQSRAQDALEKRDLDGFEIANLALNSTISKLDSLAVEIPSLSMATKIIRKSMEKAEQAYTKKNTLMETLDTGMYRMLNPPGFRPPNAEDARVKALQQAKQY